MMTTSVAIEGEKTKMPASHTFVELKIPELDEDMAWFVGLFQTYGHVSPNYQNSDNGSITEVSCADKSTADKIRRQLERFGDFVVNCSENSKLVYCRSKELAWYLDQNVKNEDGDLSVPLWIFNSTIDIKFSYIGGLITICKQFAQTEFVNKSTTFIKQLQNLLYSCGIDSKKDAIVVKSDSSLKEVWEIKYKLSISPLNCSKIFKVENNKRQKN